MRDHATVNGTVQQVDDVWPGESLLYVLRERMGLPGSKNACEQGECGSCTVYLDGEPVCACLVRRRPGDRPRGDHRRGRWPTASGCIRCRRRSSSAAPSSAGSAPPASSSPRTTCSPACHARGPGDPRGAGRQPVPLHRLREDPGRGPARRGAAGAGMSDRRPPAPGTDRSRAPARPRSATSPLRPDGTLKVTGEFAYAQRPVADEMAWGVDPAQPAPACPDPRASTSPPR